METPTQEQWLVVTRAPKGADGTTHMRIEDCGDGSFLVHTREGAGEFDTWLASAADLIVFLGEFEIAET